MPVVDRPRSRAAFRCALVLLIAALAFSRARGGEAGDGPPPDPPAPIAAKPAIEEVPLRGLVLRTPDGLFELAVGFNLQVRFSRFDFDPVPGASEDASEFRVRRFKLSLSGLALDPRLTYRFQAAFENAANGRLLLDDAWINWRFSDAVSLQGGQSKTPFGRSEIYNDGVIQFLERAPTLDAFKPGRDAGAWLIGSVGKGRLAYAAGVFGGAGQTTTRATDHVMPMLRLVANPLGDLGAGEADLDAKPTPLVSFGVDGFTNTLRKTGDRDFESNVPNYASASGWLGRNIGLFSTGEDVAVKSASADVQFKWRGLSAQSEYFWGRAMGDSSGVVLRAVGWYAQAGYLIIPHRLDLAARYSVVDSNRAAAGDRTSAVTGIADYYFRRHQFKIEAEYTRTVRERETSRSAVDHVLRLQAQLML